MLNKINELENWISINQFSSLDAVNETMVLDAGAVVEFIKSLKDDLDEGQMVLDAPARVGGGIFQKGIKWSTVIGAAQRLYENEIREPIKPIITPADMLRIATGELVLVPKEKISNFYQEKDGTEIEEGELCINTGNWINMCAALLDVTKNQYGDIQSQVWTNRANNTSRLQIVAGRFKKNRVALNNCPFCGENIATSYKDSSEDK